MKTKTIKQQKGITLIALVITIIVLLILAGVAISMLSGENGILRQAATAKTETEKRSEEEAVELAAIEAMTYADHTITYDRLTTALDTQFGANQYSVNPPNESEMWEITVNKTGNHYAVTGNGEAKHLAWYYTTDGTQITNGTDKITLGDTIDYNPIAGLTAKDGVYKQYESKVEKNGYGTDSQIFKLENNTETTGQKLTWVVLGTDENGDILIVPTKNIKDASGATQKFFLNGQAGAQYGVEEVNNVASIYGYGKGAKSARAIQVEDINKVTGFNPNDVGEGKKYGSGTIYEYGNKITYTWNTTNSGKIDCSGSNGITVTSSNMFTSKGFNWLDVATNAWKSNTAYTGTITTLTSTSYSYDLTTANCGNLYDSVVALDGQDIYWLGSTSIMCNENPNFGLRAVNYHMVTGPTVSGGVLVYANGSANASAQGKGVRPAVSLVSDIKLAPNGANAWTIQ